MIVRPHEGMIPRLGLRVFVAENATLVGDVKIGDDSSVWFGTVIRADIHFIRIGARTNIQDNCTLHVTGGTAPVTIGDQVTMGHGVIAHGCTIGNGALIGMGSRLLDGCVIGERALVAAGSIVPEGMHVPPRTLLMGVPGRVRRELTAEELERVDGGWKAYSELKEKYLSRS